jgi:hypothetical protein
VDYTGASPLWSLAEDATELGGSFKVGTSTVNVLGEGWVYLAANFDRDGMARLYRNAREIAAVSIAVDAALSFPARVLFFHAWPGIGAIAVHYPKLLSQAELDVNYKYRTVGNFGPSITRACYQRMSDQFELTVAFAPEPLLIAPPSPLVGDLFRGTLPRASVSPLTNGGVNNAMRFVRDRSGNGLHYPFRSGLTGNQWVIDPSWL